MSQPADIPSPLTEEHLALINDSLANIDVLKGQIKQAKRAGIDVTSLEAQLLENEKKLRQIKQVYFPGRA